jgi:hypothetical protein
MDPISLVVAAVVAGASAGLKETVADSVKDAYQALKALLSSRRVELSGVERKPDSASKQSSLREDLRDLVGPNGKIDESTLAAAQHLLAMVRDHDPDAAKAVGIDLDQLDVGGSLSIKGVTAAGTGIRGKDWKAAGDVVIENINVGHGDAGSPAASPGSGGAKHPS